MSTCSQRLEGWDQARWVLLYRQGPNTLPLPLVCGPVAAHSFYSCYQIFLWGAFGFSIPLLTPGDAKWLATGPWGSESMLGEVGVPEPTFLLGLDLLPLCVTFLLCFWEVQYGILAGTLVSLIILLHSVARPKIQVGSGERKCGWESLGC